MRCLPLLLLTACWTYDPADLAPWGPGIPGFEDDARWDFRHDPIEAWGQVLDQDGDPLAGVEVSAHDVTTTTDDQGQWVLDGLPRRSALVRFSLPGHREELHPIDLSVPVSIAQQGLAPVTLRPMVDGEIRLLFTGDVAMGRRFLDVDESTPWYEIPPDDPEALIQTSDPLPGSREALRWMGPILAMADFPVVNLETPVITSPDTPHDTKPYVFFTLPGSVEALMERGIQYVSLGNNHVYDYLEGGLTQTLDHLDRMGMGYSGAGHAPERAWEPYEVEVRGLPLTMISASSITGHQYEVGFNATEDKGGSANLGDSDRLTGHITEARALGRMPIVQMHTGSEYTERVSEYSASQHDLAAESGAALLIAHHPHFAQGFGFHKGVLAAHCLGNFVLDQDRLETMLGMVLIADMHAGGVETARALPIYLEDYRPRVLTGALASRLIRRVGWSSEGHGARVVEHAGYAMITDDDTRVRTERRTVQVLTRLGDGGVGVLDLRDHALPMESLVGLSANQAITARLGRDLLTFGDFEDYDVDEHILDVARWDVEGDSRFPCASGARTGAVGLCTIRDDTHRSPSMVTFRNRIRVEGDAIAEPIKDLTVLGWTSGDNAGFSTVRFEYAASEGEELFGIDDVYTHVGGTWDWERFAADLALPPDTDDPLDRLWNPRALRLRLLHEPPVLGRGVWRADDLAVISWAATEYALSHEVSIAGPHPYDFVRLSGPEGSVLLTLTLERSYWVTP